jgi:hypothetical protein
MDFFVAIFHIITTIVTASVAKRRRRARLSGCFLASLRINIERTDQGKWRNKINNHIYED